MKSLAPFALVLSLLAPAAPAVAADEFMAVRVSHADLDLNQPRDAAIMLGRLQNAALDACGASIFSARGVQDEVRASSCYRQSLDRAVADLGAAGVSALHQAKTQRLALN